MHKRCSLGRYLDDPVLAGATAKRAAVIAAYLLRRKVAVEQFGPAMLPIRAYAKRDQPFSGPFD